MRLMSSILFLKAKSRQLITPHGFTLIELLVVIAIISLLSSVVLASLSTSRLKAKDAAIKENMIGIRTLAGIYFSDNNNYLPSQGFVFCDSGNVDPGTMFSSTGPSSAKRIAEAITQITSLISEVPSVICGAGANTFVVVARLNEVGVGPNPTSWFCIDSSGTSKVSYTAGAGLPPVVNFASEPYECS